MPRMRIEERAETLIEALPYIQRFSGCAIVIKYGGSALTDEAGEAFAKDAILLQHVGIRPVIVHGGGPQIERMLRRVGKRTEFVEGMRVTDGETMEVVEMVLVGQVNKALVEGIQRQGGRAVGLSGKDGGLIQARRLGPKAAGGKPGRDLGLVGEVEEIRPQVLRVLEEGGFIPVIAPVGMGPRGETLNVNADSVAGAVAASLGAEKLILLTDVDGVKGKDGKLLSSLDAPEVHDLLARGVVSGGMIPKVRCCLDALARGVAKAHIVNGKVRHAILLELFTDRGIGTEIRLGGAAEPDPGGGKGKEDSSEI